MTTATALTPLAWLTLAIGAACCAYIALDQRQRPAPMMAIMRWVWPINALWAGPFAIWAYRAIGNGAKPKQPPSPPTAAMADMPDMRDMAMTDMTMPGMDMPMNGMHGGHEHAMLPPHAGHTMAMPMTHGHSPRPFWQSIVAGTLHCGAGCTLADLITPWLFLAAPFLVLGSPVFGEWTLAYALALLVGVAFQYGGLLGMVPEHGAALWWRALKVDFFSLSAWQVGMYGWMAFALFDWLGPLPPNEPVFWLMMQLAMACGFLTAYPMNWLLVRLGVKSAM